MLGYPSAGGRAAIRLVRRPGVGAVHRRRSRSTGCSSGCATAKSASCSCHCSARARSPEERGAARATSICAVAQNVFWQYADRLFAWESEFGADAFSGERLLVARAIWASIRRRWTTCFTSDSPDVILNDAQQAANNEATFSATPVVVGDSPSLTDIDSLNFTIDLMLQLEQILNWRPRPRRKPRLRKPRQESGSLHVRSAGARADRAAADDHAAGRLVSGDALVLQDIDGIRPIPFAVYGSGQRRHEHGVLLWGFPNLIKADSAVEPDVWTDGTTPAAGGGRRYVQRRRGCGACTASAGFGRLARSSRQSTAPTCRIRAGSSPGCASST
ncbi:MAG: hypothetical protein U0703_29340 [Anaerolineae bacterium]